MKTYRLSQAITGYMLYANSRRLSVHTLADYQNTFKKLQAALGDPPINSISEIQIQQFMAAQTVSNKTLLNYHIGLSALWTWAVRENLAAAHILHHVPKPRPDQRVIQPLSEEEIKSLFSALKSTRAYTRPGKKASSHSLPSSDRNRAILLLMLDTGLRVSELCNLLISDVDVRSKLILVMGKGGKERSIPFSARTGQALWKYLASRPDDIPTAPLFKTSQNRPLTPNQVLHIFTRLGSRAGVHNVHPHRLRHTFAIAYLRNAGNARFLQTILGHSTSDMVNRYLSISEQDLAAAHRTASPVENWRL
jgi:integrase/recombinase XerD